MSHLLWSIYKQHFKIKKICVHELKNVLSRNTYDHVIHLAIKTTLGPPDNSNIDKKYAPSNTALAHGNNLSDCDSVEVNLVANISIHESSSVVAITVVALVVIHHLSTSALTLISILVWPSCARIHGSGYVDQLLKRIAEWLDIVPILIGKISPFFFSAHRWGGG